MELAFLGGASEIGASCTVMKIQEKNFLIDCGIRFKKDRPLPNLDFLSEIDIEAIFVTHAHTDHSGALPLIHKAFPLAPIYMTPPTKDLITVLHKDALRIMDGNLDAEGELPLYTEKEVESMLMMIRLVHHNYSVAIGEIVATYYPASHILGASMIYFETDEGRVLFSGDYSMTPQKTLQNFAVPKIGVDLFISEATYGNRLHSDRKIAEKQLIEKVQNIVEEGGRVLIPAFAIGRAQEVILILKEAIKRGVLTEIPVYVDGMVRSVCSVYTQHERYVSNYAARLSRNGSIFYDRLVTPISSPLERTKVLDKGPCVIVSSSGMLSGGASAFYASKMVSNEKDAIIITGYQDEESPGRALLNLAKKKDTKKIILCGTEMEVKCRFDIYSLSAHADKLQMITLINTIRPKTVVLVHGDQDAKESFAQSLGNMDIILAEDGMVFSRNYPKRRTKNESVNIMPEVLVEKTEVDEELEKLKKENPKGELFTMCQSAKIGRPRTFFKRKGGLYELQFKMSINGKEIKSDFYLHKSKKITEHLAAKEMISKIKKELQSSLPSTDNIDDLILIDKELAEELRSINPKGRLLELLMQTQMEIPKYHFSPMGGLFRVYGEIKINDGTITRSKIYQTSQKKMGEQAICQEFLKLLETLTPSKEDRPIVEIKGQNENPLMILNELKQQAIIKEFGIDLLKKSGDSHCPMFTMIAWVVDKNGERILGDYQSAPSKKVCKNLAAYSLIKIFKLYVNEKHNS